MDYPASGKEEESLDQSCSSGEDETERNAMNQLELVNQFGAMACMFVGHDNTQ
ncbi:hypothetical protein ACP4OV_011381 [Aristida adscensionis]